MGQVVDQQGPPPVWMTVLGVGILSAVVYMTITSPVRRVVTTTYTTGWGGDGYYDHNLGKYVHRNRRRPRRRRAR
jgi:hypothetical protein